MEAVITNIQHFCYHDGPGIRTNVFFKGCSLNCKWCSNPENLDSHLELGYDVKKCVKCKTCLTNPVLTGLVTDAGDTIRINFAEAKKRHLEGKFLCPQDALYLEGRSMTVEAVMEEVMLDSALYTDNGGITVSGGEPLLQPDFVVALFKKAHANFMTTAVESAGNIPWSNIEAVLPHVDTMICDIKMMDTEKHEYWTGHRNERILDNWRKCFSNYPEISYLVRTPIIPGVNDTVRDVQEILAFLKQYGNSCHIQYEPLKYHEFGKNKYANLGREYRIKSLSQEEKTKYEERYEMIKRVAEEEVESWKKQ